MVKADNRRDYYGDLEVKPDADVSDIKKQFKKLGERTTSTRSDKHRLTVVFLQRSNTIPIVILAMRWNSMQDSKQYSLHTKSSPTPSNAPSMMQIVSELAYFTRTPPP